MDLIVTDEIRKELRIENIIVVTKQIEQPAILSVISAEAIMCLLPRNVPGLNENTKIKILMKYNNDYYNIDSFFTGAICKENYQIGRFSLHIKCEYPESLRIKLTALEELSNTVQKRKEERLILSKDVYDTIGISQNSIMIYDEKISECNLRDVSFSGARCLTLASEAPDLYQKFAMKINFYGPFECCFLYAQVIRKNEMHLSSGTLVDLGVVYLEPVDVNYQRRLKIYFDKKNAKKSFK